MNTFNRQLKRFKCAISGVCELIRSQKNARIHLVATIIIAILGITVKLDRMEWCVIIMAAGLVWFAEAMNTAFEKLCDLVSPDRHSLVKSVKDIAAGAVLLASMAAAGAGLIIFGPSLWALIFN